MLMLFVSAFHFNKPLGEIIPFVLYSYHKELSFLTFLGPLAHTQFKEDQKQQHTRNIPLHIKRFYCFIPLF